MTNARYLAKLKSYFAYYSSYVKDNTSADIQRMRVLTITLSDERKQNLRTTAQDVSVEGKDLFCFICERSYLGVPELVVGPIWQTLKDETLKCL